MENNLCDVEEMVCGYDFFHVYIITSFKGDLVIVKGSSLKKINTKNVKTITKNDIESIFINSRKLFNDKLVLKTKTNEQYKIVAKNYNQSIILKELLKKIKFFEISSDEKTNVNAIDKKSFKRLTKDEIITNVLSKNEKLKPVMDKLADEDFDLIAENVSELNKLNIKCMEYSRFSLTHAEINPKDVNTVVQRIFALIAVGNYAIILFKEKNIDKAREYFNEFDRRSEVKKYLTQFESEFIESTGIEGEELIPYMLKIESAYALLWCINILPEIDNCRKLIKNQDAMDKFLTTESTKGIKFRSGKDIWKFQDIYYRMIWADKDASIKNEPKSNYFSVSIIMERYRALSWLLTDVYGDDFDKLNLPS